MNKKNYISLAKKAASVQITELKKIKKVFNKDFIKAVDLILNCKGKVIFAGLGKSGLIARKISATFSRNKTAWTTQSNAIESLSLPMRNMFARFSILHELMRRRAKPQKQESCFGKHSKSTPTTSKQRMP